uniref:P-type ATPase N-terminal domain-containing protein n=1 Tax=Nomascus leucogenys TaxID=61853 RepID=G1QMV6_NOMLE
SHSPEDAGQGQVGQVWPWAPPSPGLDGTPCQATNVVRTAKYSFFSFLPLNLYEQFHRVSNLYFLLIIILQSIPDISTLPWFSLGAPMVCLLFIRAARDLVDDIGRHKSDRAINNRPCQILMGKSFKRKKWQDLCVGDVVCLRKDNIVPADVLLLASTEPSSLCYVETVDIDGETNLKFRQALMVTHKELTTTKKMASFQGESVKFNHNTVTFGCLIEKVDRWIHVANPAGFDTKIMKNCGKIHLKRTKLDLLMNKLVVVIFISVVLVCLVLAFSFGFSVKEFKDHHYYLSGLHGSSVAAESFFIFWGFLILLSVTVPMSMFILSEFIYLGNSIFIDWDVQMYYKPQDVPAKARSTSLNDHLGQVEYIFSDKTGTLTQNILTFNKCCINGRVYGAAPTPELPAGSSIFKGLRVPEDQSHVWPDARHPRPNLNQGTVARWRGFLWRGPANFFFFFFSLRWSFALVAQAGVQWRDLGSLKPPPPGLILLPQPPK